MTPPRPTPPAPARPTPPAPARPAPAKPAPGLDLDALAGPPRPTQNRGRPAAGPVTTTHTEREEDAGPSLNLFDSRGDD